MDIEIIKKTKEKAKMFERNIEEENLNVVAYARVSTGLDDQINSFESQVKYFSMKINRNPNWKLTKIYSDEGYSGKNIRKRQGFQEMIEDAKEKKFDLILTKSISRFARNTLELLENVRFLKNLNIPIIFEEEHINTMDMQSELLLTILASIAQQEIQNLSSNVKLRLKNENEKR